MKLLPMGSSSAGVRWHAVPDEGEEIDIVAIRKIFIRTCPGRSLAFEDLRNGSYVLIFPDGIGSLNRATLYNDIVSAGFVLA